VRSPAIDPVRHHCAIAADLRARSAAIAHVCVEFSAPREEAPAMDQGNVVLLNGTSSAGKTSIARALQEIMETPYLHTGTDAPMARVHPKFATVSDGVDLATSDYMLMVYEGGATRVVDEYQGQPTVYGTGILKEVRIGPGALTLYAGQYRAIAALASAGLDVVVDDVIFDRRVLAVAVEALVDSNVLFVGIRVPREVAERRERERGDRGPGGAAAFYDLVHAHGVYDLDVDTSVASPMECALRIKDALETNHPRLAFRQLAAKWAEQTRRL
jgi:chloramphenicol 3-O phosphotransferase